MTSSPPAPRERRPSVSKNGLCILQAALGLTDSSGQASPPIIMAIDFENTCNIKNGFSKSRDCQLGIATLDTRFLSQPLQRKQKIISTHNYISGSDSYIKRASKKYAFGKSTVIQTSEICRRISEALPEGRDVILLGHAIRNELEVLHALGSNLGRSVLQIVDTFRVANEVFEFWAGSLGDLLTRLECPFDSLHSAGNDANYTLKAALLLAATGSDNQQAVDQLTQISIPPMVCYSHEKKSKRQKRLEKSKRFKAKSRSLEEQNQIREQRAVKRDEAESLRLPK